MKIPRPIRTQTTSESNTPTIELAEVTVPNVGAIRTPPMPWDASRPLLAAVPYVRFASRLRV